VEVAVAPSQVHLATVRDSLRKDIHVSAQDVWKAGAGAFTGKKNDRKIVSCILFVTTVRPFSPILQSIS
jgi:triosephosphate isomerase